MSRRKRTSLSRAASAALLSDALGRGGGGEARVPGRDAVGAGTERGAGRVAMRGGLSYGASRNGSYAGVGASHGAAPGPLASISGDRNGFSLVAEKGLWGRELGAPQ